MVNNESELDKARVKLEGFEDVIIESFCRRLDFKHNQFMYQSGSIPGIDSGQSFFEYKFRLMEKSFGKFGAWIESQKLPFFIKPKNVELSDNSIAKLELSDSIILGYKQLLTIRCDKGTDKDYHEAFKADYVCLGLIMERVLGGIEVIKAKYEGNEKKYNNLIRDNNIQGIKNELRDKRVEKKVISSVSEKCRESELNDDCVGLLYESTIIPCTVDVQAVYLMGKDI